MNALLMPFQKQVKGCTSVIFDPIAFEPISAWPECCIQALGVTTFVGF